MSELTVVEEQKEDSDYDETVDSDTDSIQSEY